MAVNHEKLTIFISAPPPTGSTKLLNSLILLPRFARLLLVLNSFLLSPRYARLLLVVVVVGRGADMKFVIDPQFWFKVYMKNTRIALLWSQLSKTPPYETLQNRMFLVQIT